MRQHRDFAPELAQNLGTLACVNNVNYAGYYFFEGNSSGDATIRATTPTAM